MSEQRHIGDLKGLIASISLTGTVTYQFSQCFAELRSYNERSGLINVEYQVQPGVLVEEARDSVVMHALDPRKDGSQQSYDWILQIDADATFPPNTLHRLLEQAYLNQPSAGVVGTYAQLKSPPHFPTIDTGTGTWEEHYPGEGLLQVIRTGCHCFLTKTAIFQIIGPPPWFRTRLAMAPLTAFHELDGFARRTLAGTNPLRSHPEWETLERAASTLGVQMPQHVGEDSSFFDRCNAWNIEVFVDTDLVTGHVSTKVIQPSDFVDNAQASLKKARASLGVG